MPRAILMDLVSCPNLLMTHNSPPLWSQPALLAASSNVHAVHFKLAQKDPSYALGTETV